MLFLCSVLIFWQMGGKSTEPRHTNAGKPPIPHKFTNCFAIIPLWVLINTLTYGQISRFYALLPFQIQSGISKDFPSVNKKNLERYLKILTLFRNVCAHNERLYSFRKTGSLFFLFISVIYKKLLYSCAP